MSELVDKCTQHRHYMANGMEKYKESIHMPEVIHSKKLQIYAKNFVYYHRH